MSDTPTVTLSMFWPLLMQAAENEDNPNAIDTAEALRRSWMDRGINPDTEMYCEDVAEALAREHFQSGSVEDERFYWDGSLWGPDHDATFEDVLRSGCGWVLSPADPQHVAMVLRILAISFGIKVFSEPPILGVMPDTMINDNIELIYGVRLSIRTSRPWVWTDGNRALDVGHFVQTGDRSPPNVADMIWKWFEDRYAEVNFILDAAAESGETKAT